MEDSVRGVIDRRSDRAEYTAKVRSGIVCFVRLLHTPFDEIMSIHNAATFHPDCSCRRCQLGKKQRAVELLAKMLVDHATKRANGEPLPSAPKKRKSLSTPKPDEDVELEVLETPYSIVCKLEMGREVEEHAEKNQKTLFDLD